MEAGRCPVVTPSSDLDHHYKNAPEVRVRATRILRETDGAPKIFKHTLEFTCVATVEVLGKNSR